MANRTDVDDDTEAQDGKGTSGKSPIKTILLITFGALTLVGVSVIGTYFLTRAAIVSAIQAAEAQQDQNGDDEAEEDTDKKGKKGKKSKKGKKGKKGKKKNKAAKEKPSQPIVYLPLDPPFVVNFENSEEARFLQVSMEVMARDSDVLEAVKKHMPAIRNNLVLLLSSQEYKTLSSFAGKEAVRTAALAEIQKILNEYTGKPGVEAVYFTGFVMQ